MGTKFCYAVKNPTVTMWGCTCFVSCFDFGCFRRLKTPMSFVFVFQIWVNVK